MMKLTLSEAQEVSTEFQLEEKYCKNSGNIWNQKPQKSTKGKLFS